MNKEKKYSLAEYHSKYGSLILSNSRRNSGEVVSVRTIQRMIEANKELPKVVDCELIAGSYIITVID